MFSSRWVAVSIALAITGCTRVLTTPPPSPLDPGLGQEILRIDGTPYYSKQVTTVSTNRSIQPAEAVQHLVDMDVLARLSEKNHPWNPSELRYQQAIVQRYIEKNIAHRLTEQNIPEAYLRAVYEERSEEYRRPRQADIEVLAIYTGARMKIEARQKRAETARELYTALKTTSFTVPFSEVMNQGEWSKKKVNLKRLFQGPDSPLPAAVGSAVLAMNKVGQVTPLIEDEDGYFIARYLGERPPIDIPFEAVRDQLAASTFERWRDQNFLTFAQKLMQSHRIEFSPSR